MVIILHFSGLRQLEDDNSTIIYLSCIIILATLFKVNGPLVNIMHFSTTRATTGSDLCNKHTVRL